MAAVAPANHHHLDPGGAAQDRVGGGPPRELEVAGAQAQRLPVGGGAELLALVPPDVPAGGVDELDLQIIDAAIAAHAQRQRVVDRPVDRQRPRGIGIARYLREVVIEPQPLAGRTGHRLDPRRDAVRRRCLPAGERGKRIGHRRLRGDRCEDERQRRDHAASQPPVNPARSSPRRIAGCPRIVCHTSSSRALAIIPRMGP